MSRIGKKSIEIPEKVKMAVTDSGAIKVEGPKGKLEWVLPKQIKLRVEGKQAVLDRNTESRNVKALHGLSRSLIHNMVIGVSQGFQKGLEIHGVGFRAQVQGKNLNLNIGFSPGFGPNLIFYQAARFVDETNNTGWLATGTWLTQ